MTEQKELGTRVSEAITALTGKEPCEGCKRRAVLLNEVGRRGFIRGGMFAAFLVKNTMVKGLWYLAGVSPPVGTAEALGFVRQFNTFQVGLICRNGSFGVSHDVFSEIIAHREHFIPGTLGYAWMSRVNFFPMRYYPDGSSISQKRQQVILTPWLERMAQLS